MDLNNNIIDFEEEFKNNEEEFGRPVYNDPDQKYTSLFSILTYIVLFFLGLAAVIVLFFIKPPTNRELVFDYFSLAKEEQYLAILDDGDDFDDFINKYKINDSYIYTVGDVKLLSYNSMITEDWISNNFNEIIDGTINKWNIKGSSDEVDLIILLTETDNIGSTIKSNTSTLKMNFINDYTIGQNALIMFFSYVIVLVPLFLLNRKRLVYDFISFKNDKQTKPIGFIVQGFAEFFVVTIALGLVQTLLSQAFGFGTDSVNQASIEIMLKSKYAVLMIVTVVFIGPLVEEIVFRTSIFNLVKNKKLAILISSIVFGSIHLVTELIMLFSGQFTFFLLAETLAMSIPYVGMGVFFAYLYNKSNQNLFVVYVIHALANLLSVVTIYL